MFAKAISVAVVALSASTLVSGQTFTTCDPTKVDCPPDPALGTSVDIDMTKGEPKDVLYPLAGTTIEYDATHGAIFSIKKEGDAPTMASHKYIFFGRIDVTMQSAPGAGIVSSLVLQSDDLDEIDLEWVGGNNAQVQSNYFSKGDTTTYDRGGTHAVASPHTQFHTYSIDWTKDRLQWIIDGAVVRTLTYADAKGGSIYPQTPMQFKLGTWVAGRKDAPEGTVQWAGGYTNFAEGPFVAYYKDIKITDYTTGAKQYIYGDKSGKWESIIVDKDGSAANTTSSATSSAATKSATATGSQTTLATSSKPTGGSGSSPTQGGSGSGTGSGSSSTPSSSSPVTASPNAAGSVVLTLGNLAAAGAALVAAHLFVL